MDDVDVSGQNAQAQGKSFWQEHYKLMSGAIPEVVDANMFDRPRQRRPQSVHMSYSDIARSSGSPSDHKTTVKMVQASTQLL
jgi:hypothetical protein